MKKKIFIVTGEHSGDMHAAKVVEYLRGAGADIDVEAIGGGALEAQGVKLFANHDKMSVVGLTPKIVFDHFLLGKNLVEYLTKRFQFLRLFSFETRESSSENVLLSWVN